MLAALFVPFHHREILEELGSEWVDDYAKSLRHEAKAALAQEKKTGRTDALVALLETPLWSETHFGDRAYPLKRKLLERLCVNLEQQGDYSALAHWASEWLSLNERNLDARASGMRRSAISLSAKKKGLKGSSQITRTSRKTTTFSTFWLTPTRSTQYRRCQTNSLGKSKFHRQRGFNRMGYILDERQSGEFFPNPIQTCSDPCRQQRRKFTYV